MQTAVSYLCANGMIEMLEILEDVTNLDYNLPDNDGNTPLHYACQAGHVEVVSFLLSKVRTIQVDPVNYQGFTPLMKAALQGRIKCSKLLLFSGEQIFIPKNHQSFFEKMPHYVEYLYIDGILAKGAYFQFKVTTNGLTLLCIYILQYLHNAECWPHFLTIGLVVYFYYRVFTTL